MSLVHFSRCANARFFYCTFWLFLGARKKNLPAFFEAASASFFYFFVFAFLGAHDDDPDTQDGAKAHRAEMPTSVDNFLW